MKLKVQTIFLFMCIVFNINLIVQAGYRGERSGTWSDWTGEPVPCSYPHTPLYGEIHLPNGTLVGAVAFYNCYNGYNLIGAPHRKCLMNGSWDGVAPTCSRNGCEIGRFGEDCTKTCGHCLNGACDAVTGDCPVGCRAGYEGPNCRQPCRNGTYGMGCVYRCTCENDLPCNKVNGYCYCTLTPIQNGDSVKHVEGAIATVQYRCNSGFVLVGQEILVCNRSTGVWDHSAPTCEAGGGGSTPCPANTDHRGNRWPESLPGTQRTRSCPTGFTGNVSRKCGLDGSWARPNYYCIRSAVDDIRLITSTENITKSEVVDTLQAMSALALKQGETVDTNSQLTDGELSVLSESLGEIADVLSKSPEKVDDTISDTFLETVSNMVDNSHQENWISLNAAKMTGASEVLSAMQSFTGVLSSSINSTWEKGKTFMKTNLAIEVNKVSHEGVIFPSTELYNNGSDWIKHSKSNIRLDGSVFKGSSVPYITTAIIYRNLSEIMSAKTTAETESSSNSIEDESINGPIIALSVSPAINGILDPPVLISFEHKDKLLTQPSCRFWQFKSGSDGYWSDAGCSVQFSNTTSTICTCTHLTNFAVLMSPFQEADAESLGLRVVSMVGIGVSIFCLLATLLMHILLWKYLKSDRTSLLANLCVALVLSYVLFLAGVDRTENSVVCAVIAALLHYIYLVVFSIMLAEGIEMAVTVLYVFQTKVSRIRWLLVLSWVLPAVIVGISLGVTKTAGYGSDKFCWLSSEKGLIWAFVGPTLAIILFNVGCLLLVLRAIFNSRTVEAKESSEKIKTGLRSLCVLLPVTGVSWILGMFYFSKDLYFVQYIFAICNGSQGFFLFLFHCLLSPQVKRAFKLRKRKKYAVTSMEKSLSKSTSKLDNSIAERGTETEESLADMKSVKRNSPAMKQHKKENGHTSRQYYHKNGTAT